LRLWGLSKKAKFREENIRNEQSWESRETFHYLT
jgi:hypothetical protein